MQNNILNNIYITGSPGPTSETGPLRYFLRQFSKFRGPPRYFLEIKNAKRCFENCYCANKIAYLPQQSQLDKSFPITVYDLVTTGLWEKIGFTRGITKEQKKICESALYAVGLEGFEDRLIGTLSGGQLQRTLFARVLVQDQKVILLDEPFNAIDTATLLDLTKIIQHWNKIERTVIMVTHDLEYVKEYCPKSLLLARECIDIGNTKTVLSNKNLKRARELSEAFDNDATWCME